MKTPLFTLTILFLFTAGTLFGADAEYRCWHGQQHALILGTVINVDNELYTIRVAEALPCAKLSDQHNKEPYPVVWRQMWHLLSVSGIDKDSLQVICDDDRKQDAIAWADRHSLLSSLGGPESIGVIGGADGPTAIFVARKSHLPFIVFIALILTMATTCLVLYLKKKKKN